MEKLELRWQQQRGRHFFDSRIEGKPRVLSSDRAGWAHWEFQFENMMALIDIGLTIKLEEAETQTALILGDTNAESRQRCILPFSVLASITHERPLNVVRSLRLARNGYEAKRLIVEDFKPPPDQRRLALARRSRGSPFMWSTSTCSQCSSRNGAELVEHYERLPPPPEEISTVFDGVVKRAVVLETN